MTEQKPVYVPKTSHEKLMSVLLCVVILTAGIAIGASLMFIALSAQQDSYDQHPEIYADRMLRRLNRELDLTPQQRSELDPIIRKHTQALEEIRGQVRPKIVEQLEQLDSEIAAVLDEQQNEIWDRQAERLEEHFPTFRPRRRAGQRRENDSEPGPHGPREPLGPGYRRNQQTAPNEPNQPN